MTNHSEHGPADTRSQSARVTTARNAARAGGRVAMATFRDAIDVETKQGKTDVVTKADRDTQAKIRAIIDTQFSDEAFIGEEVDASKTVPERGAAWIVDPIDGTNNYVRGMRQWTSSVATVDDGITLAAATAAPALGDLYVGGPRGTTRNGQHVSVSETTDPDQFTVAPIIWWPRDRRDEYAQATEAIVTRFGDLVRLRSAQLSLALVASGAIEAIVTNITGNPWDTVAGAYLIEQAGGTVTDLHGDCWQYDSEGLVASNGRAHETVLAAANEIDPDTAPRKT